MSPSTTAKKMGGSPGLGVEVERPSQRQLEEHACRDMLSFSTRVTMKCSTWKEHWNQKRTYVVQITGHTHEVAEDKRG